MEHFGAVFKLDLTEHWRQSIFCAWNRLGNKDTIARGGGNCRLCVGRADTGARTKVFRFQPKVASSIWVRNFAVPVGLTEVARIGPFYVCTIKNSGCAWYVTEERKPSTFFTLASPNVRVCRKFARPCTRITGRGDEPPPPGNLGWRMLV